MNSKLIVFAFILLSETLLAQIQMKLTGQLPAYENEVFVLLRGDEGGVFVVDSARVGAGGTIYFEWEGSPDFYRITGNDGHIDVRIQKPEFMFSLNGSIQNGELQFSGDDENSQYQYYLSEFDILNSGIIEIKEELEAMGQKNPLYKEKISEFKKLKREKKLLLKDLWGNYFDSWPARFALAQQELYPDLKLKGKNYDDYYEKHFFDYFAFSDSLLAGTPVFYEKIGKYLKAHKMDNLLASKNYKKISDVIGVLFWFTELEPALQKYLANYLMNRYPENIYPQVYNAVVDFYKVLNSCEYGLSTRTVQNRARNSKNLQPGWIAPDIPLYHSTDGRIESLSDVNSNLTLFVVWSSSCIHSMNLLAQINELYGVYKNFGLEVVAVCLDSNLNYWSQLVYENNYSWVNACDTDGLYGTTASLFNIYVTPSMFLIDPSLKTVAVPHTFFQLEQKLEYFFSGSTL